MCLEYCLFCSGKFFPDRIFKVWRRVSCLAGAAHTYSIAVCKDNKISSNIQTLDFF